MPAVPTCRQLCPPNTLRVPGPEGTQVAREQSIAEADPALPPLGTGQVFVLWDGGDGDSFAVPSSPCPPAFSSSSARGCSGLGLWAGLAEGQP